MPLIREKALNLRNALVQAFPSPQQFKKLLLPLKKNFESFSIAGSSFEENVMAVIKAAEAESWILDLVYQASEVVPADQVLQEYRRDIASQFPDQCSSQRLKGQEIGNLVILLRAAFLRNDFENLLLFYFSKPLDDFVSPTDDYPTALRKVVEKANAQLWWRDLLRVARDKVPADKGLAAFEKRTSFLPAEVAPSAGGIVPAYKPEPSADIDHFEVCRLSGSHVMINRSTLRAALRGMSNPFGKRILVVKGDKRTGKSHTVQLISYLYQVRRSFSPVIIDLEDFGRIPGKSGPVDPFALAQRLVRQTGYDLKLERPSDEQGSTWVLDFCDDFQKRALEDSRERWIVIDAFNSDNVLLAQSTFDLVKELALRINRILTNLRLVLLGYSETFPSEVLGHVEEEQIGAIGAKDLLDFFAKAYRQMQIPYDDAHLVTTVARLLEQLDPAQSDFLSRLGPRASEELARMINSRGGQ